MTDPYPTYKDYEEQFTAQWNYDHTKMWIDLMWNESVEMAKKYYEKDSLCIGESTIETPYPIRQIREKSLDYYYKKVKNVGLLDAMQNNILASIARDFGETQHIKVKCKQKEPRLKIYANRLWNIMKRLLKQ